jgi:predicted dinucleotide-binding enzyme
MTRVAIVGTGDEAHALAHLFSNYDSETSCNYLEVTKPNVKKAESVFHDTGVRVVEFESCLYRADVVILAIPARGLNAFLNDNLDLLRDKILVDVSNSSIRGEDLNSALGMTDIKFVKAFNDIGAVDMLLNKPTDKHKIETKMCSKYPEAVDVVKRFAERSLGMNVKVIPYENYFHIAGHQNTLGVNWMNAAFLMMTVFTVAEVYAILR